MASKKDRNTAPEPAGQVRLRHAQSIDPQLDGSGSPTAVQPASAGEFAHRATAVSSQVANGSPLCGSVSRQPPAYHARRLARSFSQAPSWPLSTATSSCPYRAAVSKTASRGLKSSCPVFLFTAMLE